MNARLAMERDTLARTVDRSAHAFLHHATSAGHVYEIVFDVRTLVRRDGAIREETLQVPVLYELASNHPATPPLVIAGRTDLWNVHVHNVADGCSLPPLAFVCV